MSCLCEFLPSLGQIIFTLITFYALKFGYAWYKSNFTSNTVPQIYTFFNHGSSKIRKQDWKKDVVYLYQYKRAPYMPQLSPPCLKVEAFLRLHDIKYEVIETATARSKKGLLPFIELNGEHIADSQFIIFHLRKHFNIKDHLTEEQQVVERSFDRLFDCSFFGVANYSKFKDNPSVFVKKVLELYLGSSLNFLAPLLTPMIMSNAKQRFAEVAQHSDDEILTILRKDLQAVEKYLSGKEWFFGNQTSYMDVLIFAHVVPVYYIPYRHSAKDLITSEFPEVLKHVKKIEKKYFSEFKFGN